MIAQLTELANLKCIPDLSHSLRTFQPEAYDESEVRKIFHDAKDNKYEIAKFRRQVYDALEYGVVFVYTRGGAGEPRLLTDAKREEEDELVEKEDTGNYDTKRRLIGRSPDKPIIDKQTTIKRGDQDSFHPEINEEGEVVEEL